MRIFMIGGTGLLGAASAKELIERGHEVVSVALQGVPVGTDLPPEMEIVFGNYLEMKDEEILGYMSGCEGFVFAAGVDERVEGPAPIYDLFKKYNIDSLNRLLRLAKKSGIQHTVICGSYFAHFAKTKPELNLTKWHPYIRSRIDQENAALAYAEQGFDVAVLELPYIFGTQPGRKPVWVFLVEQIMQMKKVILYPRGGSTMVTVRQVSEAVAGALEKNRGGKCYPIGYYNLKWTELLTIVQKYLGCPEKKIITIPDWMYALGGRKIRKDQQKKNLQGGLDMVRFTKLQCSELFIDKSEGCEYLGVRADDIEAAIGDSILLCKEVLQGKTSTIDMKGE